MTEIVLYGGDKNLSSWTLRTWLLLKRLELDFQDVLIRLDQPGTTQAIRQHSPSGRVPAIEIRGFVVWDSLAIAEYLAEDWPQLWPQDRRMRALARSVCAEMHAGFETLRSNLPMDLQARVVTPVGCAADDIRRIVEIWRVLRSGPGSGGGFLFGEWSIADAFFTPVATRFRTHSVDVSAYGDDGEAARYANLLLATPEFLVWERLALAEAAV